MNREEFQQLQAPGARELIERHVAMDPADFVMRFRGRADMPARAIAEQIACRRKARKKLPELSKHNLLYTKLALEQASGEVAASFKAGLLSGGRMMDMSGGLGIDAFFFARRFREVVYCERDELLASVAGRNFRELGRSNIVTRIGDSVGELAEWPDDSFDWIYLDPARREREKRSVALEASSPDVVALHDLLLAKSRNFCVKASPLLETGALREKLPSLSEVMTVSVDGECKEVLLFCGRGTPRGLPVVIRAACLQAGREPFLVSDDEGDGNAILAGEPGEYLYEPDPAIIKARLTRVVAARFGLRFISPSVDYLTASRRVGEFPGRSFRIAETVVYKPKTFRKFLDVRGIGGASIQRRDFPLSPEEIRRKFRLKESDETYLFFTRDAAGALLCVRCSKR
ncbi:hypothetical protein CHL67_11360 [Prosthecochloris sp. GSB1]|uniref:class I SAM-dependent methyltransferase n=1 Tax=Prosthecochloris sp. GSB1 TaxID=281093 RepID=UPI000B8CB8AA|nr:hypothetical protein [Prosthecochloris sp. GSB1]ASQ91438.1 hypothetical protein CHL67_11360 [Prosthecochloris sp. GSB1]